MIKIENLSFSYGDNKIFKDFSLTVANGDRVCFFGPSGVGKTTLLRVIMGLETALSGKVDTENAVISAVFQEDRLLPFKTVLENLTLFTDEESAKECLDELGLSHAEGLYPAELSGGMARRVAIARALSINADVYVFDEAFSGLDAENVQKAAAFINKKTSGKIVLAVSHNLTDAERLNAQVVDITKVI